MKVLLIQGWLGRREKPIFPLGLCYVASALTSHEIRAVDPNVLEQPMEDLRREIEHFGPDVIGVSLRNVDTTQYRDPFVYFPAFLETVRTCKSAAPDTPVAVGGPGFSIFAEEIMARVSDIDFGVYLEGEESFPELLQHISSPGDVKGIYYREDAGVKFSGPRNAPGFANSGAPRRDFFPMEPYLNLPDSIGIQSKRGCALTCAYCTYPFLNGANVRTRPPEQVVDEVESLVANYGVKQFTFTDSVLGSAEKYIG
ncbi:MAG: cobalamin B12-binding domain-containing protein [Candidatus Lindowbacteria bacterium]|nr:cobalamin B12-binding domain-containing protein [Candidatus Lindowbacteria bacterium]